MALEVADGASELAAVLPWERSRLVRLCAGLSGDVEAAEALAQETLLEAWRHVHHLRADDGYARWLSAIARPSVTDQYRGRVLAAFGTTLTVVNLGSMGLGSAVGDRVGVVPLLDVAGVLFFCGGVIAVVLVRGPAPGIGSSQEAA